MTLKHGVTDVECPKPGCRHRAFHVWTAERHWVRQHDDTHMGGWQ